MSESQENSNKERLNRAEESKEREAQVAEEGLTDEEIKRITDTVAAVFADWRGLPAEEKKPFLETAARTLPAKDQKELSANLAPTQPVTDWIWKVIVGVFALAFGLAVLTLCVAVLWQPSGDIQSLLTVVTTVVGILAGFISGRASTGGT